MSRRLASVLVMLTFSIVIGGGTAVASGSHSSPAQQWIKIGSIPHGDQVVGEQPEGNNLWLLLKTPATVNHGPGYVGVGVSASNPHLIKVTPVVIFALNNSLDTLSWGRTPDGEWWIAAADENFAGGVTTVSTAVWAPGKRSWTQLKPTTLSISYEGSASSPTVSIYRGTDGNAWLTSNYDEPGSGGVTQDAVYRFNDDTWRLVHAFPKIPADDNSRFALAAPAGPKALLVVTQGVAPSVVSSTGAVVKTIPAPSSLANTLLMSTNDSLAVANDGTIYFHGVGKLLKWKGDAFSSPISPGSLLTDGTWIGLWGNAPVMTIYSDAATVAYTYEGDRWTPLPVVVQKSPELSLAGNNIYNVALWSRGSALWTVSQQGTIYLLRNLRAPM